MSAIVTQSLTKRFDKLIAVNGVSFNVDKGEIFGLLGPNGAGKTTIIKMLSTLSIPTDGTAFVWGHNLMDSRDDVRRCIGMVFQDPAVDDMLTGRENLDFHARMYGMRKKLRDERIWEVLDLVGLEDKAETLLKNYSGGMKRRLEIARGLMHYPRILFLDEPTLGLDPQTRYHIWEYIRRLNSRENVTIILTTHYMEEADSLCSRIGIIDYGKILTIDTPEALKNAVGYDLLTIKVSDTEKLMPALSEKEWVKDVKKYDSQIIVSTQHGEERIPETVKLAQSLDVLITSIAIRKPTLEDVFLHYTGKTIRQEDVSSQDQVRNRLRRKRRSHP
jgi:ABC-2 type transport system ATP-binding protein